MSCKKPSDTWFSVRNGVPTSFADIRILREDNEGNDIYNERILFQNTQHGNWSNDGVFECHPASAVGIHNHNLFGIKY